MTLSLLNEKPFVHFQFPAERAQLSLSFTSASFLLGLLFDLEDGGGMFFKNVRLSANTRCYNQETTLFTVIAVRTSYPMMNPDPENN
jgi:hypothetical protein